MGVPEKSAPTDLRAGAGAQQSLRRVELWATVCFAAILGGLSVVGGFIGADRAKALFNSPPLVAFWLLLAALLIAGLFSFRRLLHSPGLLAIHLGSLLILVGAMMGSDLGHVFAAVLTDKPKVPKGYVHIWEGESSSQVVSGSDEERELLKLPFAVQLNEFSIEYYPTGSTGTQQWDLVAALPGRQEEGQVPHVHEEQLDWQQGAEVEVPGTEVQVKVLQYLPSARPTASGEAPYLEITDAKGTTTSLPAEAGREATVQDPQVKVRIAQVFSNLRVYGSGESRRIADEPQKGDNPALKVEIKVQDGTTHVQYAMPDFTMHGQEDLGVTVKYVRPQPSRAEADPSTGLPAMELVASRRGKEIRQWLFARQGEAFVGMPLAALFDANEMRGAALYMVRPKVENAPVKDYRSDLSVLEEGQTVVRKVIEVNHPLHYGGYRFYQASYGTEGGKWYTVLSVSSDSGVNLVYLGFILLTAGAFWWLWGRPAVRHFTRRSGDGA